MTILQIKVILTPKQQSKNKSGCKPKDKKKCKHRHCNDEQWDNVESCQARLVWTQVFPQGMKIPTSVKKDDTIQNMCNENDNSTNASNYHTKAAKQKEKTGRLKHRHHNDEEQRVCQKLSKKAITSKPNKSLSYPMGKPT
jgi:hypothetical protein